MTAKVDYVSVGLQKRKERDALIPAEWRLATQRYTNNCLIDVPEKCGLLTNREIDITSKYDAVDIVRKIHSKELSATETVRAFCKRAGIAQQLTNCLSEIFFEHAIKRAEELDRQREANPNRPLRPLHGLPISLKDSFNIPGFDSTVGLICFANQPDQKYSALPMLLLELGAVLYCKTNVPQTMMTADSDNNVFGRTLNPANLTLTAGGSSGGEGALIAMRGSILGVGTDIAGSIRIPSVCNGIYGFRPSADVVPYGGQRDIVHPGMPGVKVVAGPMATSMRSCAFFLETVMKAAPWKFDPECLHLRWQGHSSTRKLRVGVVRDDSMFTPWPPVRRAVDESAAKLERAGVEVIPLTLPSVQEAVGITYQMYSLDGGKCIKGLMAQGEEPPVQSVKNVNLANIKGSTLEELFDLNAARAKVQSVYHKLWLDHELDAILCPPAPTTATPLDLWGPITYTMLWNFLDYPACIIPVGKIRDIDQPDSLDHATHGEEDQHNYRMYTGPAEFANAALTVQLVGMRQEDEELAVVASSVDQILNAS